MKGMVVSNTIVTMINPDEVKSKCPYINMKAHYCTKSNKRPCFASGNEHFVSMGR